MLLEDVKHPLEFQVTKAQHQLLVLMFRNVTTTHDPLNVAETARFATSLMSWDFIKVLLLTNLEQAMELVGIRFN